MNWLQAENMENREAHCEDRWPTGSEEPNPCSIARTEEQQDDPFEYTVWVSNWELVTCEECLGWIAGVRCAETGPDF